MRRLALTVVCAGILVACAGAELHRHVSRDFRRVEADFTQTWEATIRTLGDRGFEVLASDRAGGRIETGWLTINPGFDATVFITDQEDRYSICGKPVLGQAFRTKQARLALTLSAVRQGESALRVEAFFRTQRYTDAIFWSDRALGDEACSSRGRLEEEIRMEIQLRALSDQRDRLRRGVP